MNNYKYLLSCALKANMNPLLEDSKGCSALFVFCEQLQLLPYDSCPESTILLKTVLKAVEGGGGNVGMVDKAGRNLLELDDNFISFSCYRANKHLIQDLLAHQHSSIMPPPSSSNALSVAKLSQYSLMDIASSSSGGTSGVSGSASGRLGRGTGAGGATDAGAKEVRKYFSQANLSAF